MVEKIISGAQTGADRAGLDAAIILGLMTGGWVPKGRRTEEGPLTDEQMDLYHLKEYQSTSYPGRTLQNILDADATVLFGNMSSPGSKLTLQLCIRHSKPYFTNPDSVLRAWLMSRCVRVLNVAGNRESRNPGIYKRTFDIIVEALTK